MPLTALLRRHPLAALLALALLLGLSFQGSRGLWEPDEGRYTNVALQMLHGHDFITLRRNETALHFTKPPVTYWAIATSVSSFGRNEWAVRLPMALAYVLSVLLAFRLGKVFVPGRPWLPALVYACSPIPFFAANTVNTDTLLAALESLAVSCYVAERFGAGGRRWLDLMWACFGLAFLTKGPPALLPLAAIVAFEALDGGLARVLWRPFGLLAFALIGFTWFAVVIHLHPGLLGYFLGHEVYARIATNELQRFPQWYGPFVVYLPTLVLGTMPWLLLALWRAVTRRGPAMGAEAQATGWKQWRQWVPERRFLWLWLLLPLLVFCLARSRLPLYLLPSFMPLCLLVARGMAGVRWRAVGVVLLAAWLALMLAGKYYVADDYPSDKDARQFADRLQGILPGHPEHLMFVEDLARNGLNLYFDSDIQRLSIDPQPRAISDSSYDQTVAEAMQGDDRGRVFVMKLSREANFLEAARNAGKQPLRLGTMPETHAKLVMEGWKPVYRIRTEPNRVVYTLAGDFPVPGPIRRD